MTLCYRTAHYLIWGGGAEDLQGIYFSKKNGGGGYTFKIFIPPSRGLEEFVKMFMVYMSYNMVFYRSVYLVWGGKAVSNNEQSVNRLLIYLCAITPNNEQSVKKDLTLKALN